MSEIDIFEKNLDKIQTCQKKFRQNLDKFRTPHNLDKFSKNLDKFRTPQFTDEGIDKKSDESDREYSQAAYHDKVR